MTKKSRQKLKYLENKKKAFIEVNKTIFSEAESQTLSFLSLKSYLVLHRIKT